MLGCLLHRSDERRQARSKGPRRHSCRARAAQAHTDADVVCCACSARRICGCNSRRRASRSALARATFPAARRSRATCRSRRSTSACCTCTTRSRATGPSPSSKRARASSVHAAILQVALCAPKPCSSQLVCSNIGSRGTAPMQHRQYADSSPQPTAPVVATSPKGYQPRLPLRCRCLRTRRAASWCRSTAASRRRRATSRRT
jgi:hypothetical protein